MTTASHATLIEPATLRLDRLMPAAPERVWDYLTNSALRQQWLAARDMVLQPGAAFELVWRNDELTDPPGQKPDGFGTEHRMTSRILRADRPHELAFTWGEHGEVVFTLVPEGSQTRLTLVHKRAPTQQVLLNVSAGWHAHLDILAARLSGAAPLPHWDNWVALKKDYTARFGA
ncbi:MAG: SRPBCC family protein [Beijerinckiaceae bacterium]